MATETRKLLDLILDGKQGYWTGKSVISSRGTTFEDHEGNSEIHTSKATIDAERAAAITEAINLLKDGTTDGTGNLSVDYDTLKKIAAALEGVKADLALFLTGEADGGTIDRLTELVSAINANADSIEAITSGKVNMSDIVDALTSTAADQPLSANQGHVLKGLIDSLSDSVADAIANTHAHTNKEILDGIGKSEANNLTFNGVELGKFTGIATGASIDAATDFSAQLQIVVEEYDETATA